MERRKFVVGLGSLAAGGAAAMGTGAFSSVEAERSVSVEVANDNNAYLGLSAEKFDYIGADGDDGQLTLNLGGPTTSSDGTGFNEDAVTEIKGVFEITNQGTQEVGAGFLDDENDFASNRNVTGEKVPIDGVTLTVQGTETFDGSAEGAVLSPGTGALVDVKVNTDDYDPEDATDGSVTIAAYETGGI